MLPEIKFAETDAAVVENRIITTYEDQTGQSLAPGDPVRLLMSTIAMYIVQQRVLIDFTGKQNLLYYAVNDYLDHQGVITDTERLAASQALTTMRFALAAQQASVVTIPYGTRVTPDGTLFFATTQAAEIPAGEVFVDVPVSCQTSGSAGNGYLPGQILQLVDRAGALGLIESVENLTTTTGGAEGEDDEALRERIQWAPEKYSVAGPTGAYRFWAKSVSPAIDDVQAYSPQPGQMAIVLLMADGELPSSALLDATTAALSADTLRPLCDEVLVRPPEVVAFDIEFIYYINTEQQAIATAIQAAVQQAVSDYQAWQRARLGRDIDPSQLIHLVKQAGAGRVDITQPVFTAVELWQVAVCADVALVYGGLVHG